jgi:endoglucanase
VTVREANGLLDKYGAPQATPLASINNKQFTKLVVEGAGPVVTTIKDFSIAWDLTNKQLNTFAFNSTDGKPDWYVDLKTKVTHSFDKAKPQFTLTGSGIAGLDGTYFITATATSMAWVKTDGSVAIVFN